MAAPKRPTKRGRPAAPATSLASSAYSDTPAIIESIATGQAQDGNGDSSAASNATVRSIHRDDQPVSWAPLADFAHQPTNPRNPYEYDPEADVRLAELVTSVEHFGLLQPVSVTSREAWVTHHPEDESTISPDALWVVVLGNRRLIAAHLTGLEGLAFHRNDSLATERMAVVQENYHRKGLDPVKEAAEMYGELQSKGETRRALAERIGISHGQINQRLELLKLIPDFQNLVSEQMLPVQKALPIAKLDSDEQRMLLDLGAPYTPSRLKEDRQPESGKTLSTHSTVTIRRHSTPDQVAQTLKSKLTPELLAEVRELLRE